MRTAIMTGDMMTPGRCQRIEDVLRTNRDRYWFRMKHDQALPWRFSARIDLDIVSDQDYLKEFKSGYTGYNVTDDYYNDEFNRDIDDYNDPIRLNRLNINRNWSVFNLNAEFRWYDNVISRQQEDRDTTVQRLPFIQLNAPKQRLGASPFYGTMANEYTYFYRENTDTTNSVTRDHRLDVHPRIYLPLSWKNYFTLEPSMGLRGTYWQVVDMRIRPDDTETTKPFTGRSSTTGSICPRRSIISCTQAAIGSIAIGTPSDPRIVYTYIPEEDQSTYPDFDAKDRIRKAEPADLFADESVHLPVQDSRKEKSVMEETDNPEFHYQQFLRLYLEQSYNFNEAVMKTTLQSGKMKKARKSFSPLYRTRGIDTGKIYHLQRRMLSGRHMKTTLISRNFSTTLWDRRGDRLSLEHRYKQDIPNIDQEGLESVYAKLLITMTEALSRYRRV